MRFFLHKIALVLASVTTTILASTIAEAHSVGYYYIRDHDTQLTVSPDDQQTVTPFCDGKYGIIARELNRSNIRGSVNLYRQKYGMALLPKKINSRGWYVYGAHSKKQTRLRDAQLLLERTQSHLSAEAVVDYLHNLDLSTHGGRYYDWWLRPEFLSAESGRTNAAIIAKSSTAFDWLMTDHQIGQVAQLWRMAGRKRAKETAAIFNHIDQQAQKRPGVNIWMAQYEYRKLLDHTLPPEIGKRAANAVTDVLNCQASPADYAILAKGDLGLPREYLPKTLALRRTRRDIQKLTLEAVTKGTGLDAAYHQKLRNLTENQDAKIYAAGLLLLSSPDLATAIALTEEHESLGQIAPHEQLLYGLPAWDMPDKYPALRLAHALTEGEFALGNSLAPQVRAARLKEFEAELNKTRKSLERNEGLPERYLKHYQHFYAKAKNRYDVYKNMDIQNSGLSDKTRLVLTVLFANAGHNIDPHHRDVYEEQTSAEFLDRYLRRRLFPASDIQYRNRSYRTYQPPKKTDKDNIAFSLPSLRKNDGTPEIGFAALIDWDKIESLGGDNRLTRTIALHVFDWLDNAPPKERALHAGLMSQALFDIIRMCRHENAGDLKGAPLQKHAFERLHKYYGSSESAKKTKYWWKSRRRHGNLPL